MDNFIEDLIAGTKSNTTKEKKFKAINSKKVNLEVIEYLSKRLVNLKLRY